MSLRQRKIRDFQHYSWDCLWVVFEEETRDLEENSGDFHSTASGHIANGHTVNNVPVTFGS